MRAAVFRQLGATVSIETLPDVVPGPGDVVVKVARCGICGSDLHMISSGMLGLLPGTALGHEFAGEVVSLGSGIRQLKVGDRISAMPAAGCGACAACLNGHPFACRQMRLMMGGFGEYALAREETAIRLPESLSLIDGALVEPLAASLRAVSQSRLSRGASVLVLGAGAMGLGTVFWARRLGAGTIVVVARSAWRESLARSMGADIFLAGADDLAERVSAAFDGVADVVFECIGVPGMIAQAVDLVRPRGTVVVEGCCTQPDQFVPFVAGYKELCIQFTSAYTLSDFQFVVDTFERGAAEPRALVTQTLPLDGLPGALESQRSGNRQCKVMIDPWMS